MSRIIIVVEEISGDHEFAQYVLAPKGMSGKDAVVDVTEIVARVKEALPNEYDWSNIEEELVRKGYEVPACYCARERW